MSNYLKIPFILFELKIKPIERYILALTISYGGSMYASNERLAGMFNVTRRSIINAVNHLVELGYIDKKLGKNDRVISLASGEIIALLYKQGSEEISLASSEIISKSSEIISPNRIYSKSLIEKYTFENFWKLFKQLSPSPVGSKKNAETQWQKITKKIEPQKIIDGLLEFSRQHKAKKDRGEFAASWKHCERWLKAREFDIEPTTSQTPAKTHEIKRQAAFDKFESDYGDYMRKASRDELEANPRFSELLRIPYFSEWLRTIRKDFEGVAV